MKKLRNKLRRNRKWAHIAAICSAAAILFIGSFAALRTFAANNGDYIVVFDVYDEEKGIIDNIDFSTGYEYNERPAFVTNRLKLDVEPPVSQEGYNPGYSFYKWDIGGTQYNGDSYVSSSKFTEVPDEDNTFVAYAKAIWKKDYAVNFYLGVDGVEDRIGYTDKELYLTDSTKTNGYVSIPVISCSKRTLLGWSKTENPSVDDIDYPPSGGRIPYEDFTELDSEGSVFELNLYAVWVEHVDIIYIYNLTGENARADLETDVNPNYSFRLESPSRPSGYYFVGWTTNPDGSGETLAASKTVIIEDLVRGSDGKYRLYGVWNKRYEYSIRRVDTDGDTISTGSAYPNGQTYYEQSYEASFNVADNCASNISGYTFKEYRKDSIDGEVITTASLQNDFKCDSGDYKFVLTIYAIYDIEEYDVERVMQSPKNTTKEDGSPAPSDTTFPKQNYKYIKQNNFGDVQKFPVLIAPGSIFKGWKMYYDGKSAVSASYDSANGYYYFKANDFAGKTDGTIAIKDEWETKYRLTFDTNADADYTPSNFIPYKDTQANPNDLNGTIGFGTSNSISGRAGYDSLGWSFVQNETTDFLITGNISIQKSKFKDYFHEYVAEIDRYQATLYRQWRKRFKLYYVTKSKSSVDTGKKTFERRIDENGSYDSIPFTDFDSIPKPSDYLGYTFSHWSLTEGGEAINSIDLTKFELEDEGQSDRRFAFTVYAVYTPVDFTIEYNFQEDQVETDVENKPDSNIQTVSYDDIKDNGFTPPTLFAKGYSFDGWHYSYTTTGGVNSSGDVAPGDSVPSSIFDRTNVATFKFQAKWTKLYRIHYIGNGSEKYPVNGVEEYVNFSNLVSSYTLAKPTREGNFTLYGWSLTPLEKYTGTKGVDRLYESDFTGPVERNGEWRYEATVYAVWEKQIERTYYGNGGTTSKGEEVVYKGLYSGSSLTLDKNEFFYADHRFAHWNTKSDDSGISYNDKQYVEYLEDDLVLYAIWEDETYSLTYVNDNLLDDAQISGIPDPNVVAVKYDDFYPSGYTIKLPTALGYVLTKVEIWDTNDSTKRLTYQGLQENAESYTIAKDWFSNYNDITIKFIWKRRCAIIYEPNCPREGATVTSITTMSGMPFYDNDAFNDGVYNIVASYPKCYEDIYYKKNNQTFMCVGWGLTNDNQDSGIVKSMPLESFTKVEKVTKTDGDEFYAHVVHLYAVWKERAVVVFHGNGGTTTISNGITGQTEEVDVTYSLPANSTTVGFTGFPTQAAFRWVGNFRLYVWNTEPDGSGTYYMSSSNGNLEYLRTDVENQEIIYTSDFEMESGVLHLYEQWGRNYRVNYYNNDQYSSSLTRTTSEDFKAAVSYSGTEVPVHELKPLLSGTEKRMEDGKGLYFLGWSWTPVDHALAEDEDPPFDLISNVALNDLKRSSAGGTDGDDDEYDIDKDNGDKAREDTEIHFKLEGDKYSTDVYGVWSYKPYTLIYIDGSRKDNSDVTRPAVGSVENMPQTLRVTELTYTGLLSGYTITADDPTAEGYTFKNWMIFRGSDEDSINYVDTPRVGYYGMNVRSGSNIGFYTFNNKNPSKTVILVANWEKNKRKISYYYENYDPVTGEPIMDGDKIKLTRITTESNVAYASEVGVGQNTRNWQDIYHPDFSKTNGKTFGGWELYMVNGVEVDKDQVVNDAGQYVDGILTYKNINLLQEGDVFNMPDMDLAFLAIYVSPQMTVTYDPGEGYSDPERTQKQQVIDRVEYNQSAKVRYAVHDTAQGSAPDCGFYAPIGKVFKGWKVDTARNKSKTPYPTGEGEAIENLQNNITYTAQWESGKFYVSYDFRYDFGSGTQPDDIVYIEAAAPGDVGGQKVLITYGYNYNDEVTVQANPTSYESRKGENDSNKVYDASKYVFSGWKKILPDDLIITEGKFNMPAMAVLFEGVFDYREYTVTYDADCNGQIAAESTTYDASNLSVKAFESTGFTAPAGKEFDHWELQPITDSSINPNYPSEVGETIGNLMDNITYKAIYRDAGYHVYYQLADDSVDPNVDLGAIMYTLPADSKDYVMGDIAYVLEEPRVAGYTFSGWTVKSPEGVVTTQNQETNKLTTLTIPAGDVILQGSFTRDSYIINYVMNLDGSDYDTVVETVTFQRIDAEPDGYVFDDSLAPTLVNNGAERYYEFNTAVVSHKRVPDGYTFLKWSTVRDGNGGTEPKLTFDPEKKNYEVYGIWYNWSYTLTYDGNGHGTDNMPNPNPQSFSFADVTMGKALISTSVPTEAGYNFKSWYIENSENSALNKTFAKGTEDRVIPRQLFDESDRGNCHATAVAQWEKLYQLNFDTNGADIPTIDAVTFARDLPDTDETYTFSPPTLSKPYNTFQGWTLQIKDERGEVIEEISVSGNTVPLSKFKLIDSRHQATLKALWKADDQYTVTYKITGDYLTDYSYLPVEQPHYKGDTFYVAAKIQDAEGYTFHGWYYNNTTYENQQEFIMPDGNVVFTGYFTPNANTVEYYKEDGENLFTSEPLTFDYNSDVTVGRDKSGIEIATHKDGYEFIGWELMADSAKQGADNSPIPTVNGSTFKMPNSTVKFRATYKRLYTLVYNANGGQPDTVPQSVKFEVEEGGTQSKILDYVEGSAPKWYNHKFLYWSTTPNGGRADTVTVSYNSTGYELDDEGRYVINVYAVWQEPFTVTYRITGSVLASHSVPDSFAKYPGESFNVAQVLAEEGYEFSGWHYQYGTENQIYANQEPFEMPEHDVEFTGQFTENIYTLYFKDSIDDSDLGNHRAHYTDFMKNEDGTPATKGGIVIKLDNQAKYGYVFRGWALSKTATEPDYHKGDRVEQDIEKGIFGSDKAAVVYALWSIKTITLTYDRNGAILGYPPDSVTVTGEDILTVKVAENNGNSANPNSPLVRAGYKFVGWNSVKDSRNPATHYDPGESASFTTDTTLYAEWERIDYVELTYDANGGVNGDGGDVKDVLPASESGAKPLETTVKSPSDKLVKPGYKFVGWKDSDGQEYSIGSRYTFTKDTVLYAQWEALPIHTVTYKAIDENGVEIPLNPSIYGARQYYEGETVTVAAKLDNKSGCTFSGWSYGGRTYGGSDSFAMPDSDVELYGQYTLNASEGETFDITYISGVDENQPGYTPALGKSYTVACYQGSYHNVLAHDSEELNYIREGYHFLGWRKSESKSSGNSAGTVESENSIALLNDFGELIQQGYELYVDGDITLTAVWGQYILTYDANFSEDGKGTPPEAKGYAAGTWVEVASADGLTRENARFLYWNTDRDGTGEIYHPYPHDKGKIQMNSDITLYAIWETRDKGSQGNTGYILTYDANGATSGSVPIDTRRHPAGDRFTVEKKGTLERSGCTFKEWNTRADGLGEGYKDGEDIFTMPNGNATLYAIWINSEGSVVSPKTGESVTGIQIAFSAALLSLIAGAFIVTKRVKRRKYE